MLERRSGGGGARGGVRGGARSGGGGARGGVRRGWSEGESVE